MEEKISKAIEDIATIHGMALSFEYGINSDECIKSCRNAIVEFMAKFDIEKSFFAGYAHGLDVADNGIRSTTPSFAEWVNRQDMSVAQSG